MENLKIDVRELSAPQKEDVFKAIEKFINTKINVKESYFYFIHTGLYNGWSHSFRCDLYEEKENKEVTYNELMEIAGMSDKKTFTKADLKDGMVTKYSNGDLRLVLNNTLKGKDFGWMPLEDLDDGLNHNDSDWSVDEVFLPNAEYYNLSQLFDESKLTSIWKRPPAKTQTEIELEKLQQQIAELQAQANKLQQTL